MERLLLESAVRATLIAAGTAVVLWAFGIKNARARHKAWTGVVLLMLLLPLWTATELKVSLRVLMPATVPGESPATLDRVSGGVAIRDAFVEPAGGLPDTLGVTESAKRLNWRMLLLGIYLSGVSALLLRLAIGTVRAHRLIRSAVMQDGRRISGSCVSPITVGWLRPVVILPRTWQRWPNGQLDAVLTHEGEHARRYDPLVQWLALLNRAVFWFHPLAWWLERRLGALAEQACDTAVLATGHAPQDYSEYLLDLARSTMDESRRLSFAGMAMPGRYLTRRIQEIFEGVPMQPISRMRIACTLALCTISSAIFAAATLAPQQIPVDSKVAITSTGALTEAVTQDPIPLVPQVRMQTRPALPSPPTPIAVRVRTPAPPQLTAVSQQLPEQIIDDQLNNITFGFSVAAQQRRGGGTTPVVSAQMQQEMVDWRNATARTGIWWPNPVQLAGLGLTDEQRARIAATLESHSQDLTSSREQIEKEEAQFARLLEADPIDRGAILIQLDRLIQARGEMERINAAMTLEMREYLTQAQWMQLQTNSSWQVRRLWLPGTTGGVGARGAPRGGRGQQ